MYGTISEQADTWLFITEL